MMDKEKQLVGEVTHFFTNISVALVELSAPVKVGERLSFEGSSTNFEQDLDSMQVHNEPVKEAKAGDAVGIKVKERAREGDQVFRV